MQFEDLQHFLSVRPGLGILEARDDRVATPFKIPGTEEEIGVSVRRMEGGSSFVHDDARADKALPGTRARFMGSEGALLMNGWIDAGLSFDEEGRIFTIAHDDASLGAAIARVISAQIELGAFALTVKAR